MDALIQVGVRILEFLFFAGLLGSAVVVVWSFIQDLSEIFTPDEPSIQQEEQKPRTAA